jgi:EmrB/QacA subfamily drug resistance transporter
MHVESNQTATVARSLVAEAAVSAVREPFSIARRQMVVGSILIGIVLVAFEATVVSTAMPTVVSSLSGLHMYSWVFTAYLFTSTISVPLWGKLSDLFGRRRFYLSGVVVFVIGSGLCGQAGSMEALILFRAIQGIGAGAVIPLSLTIIADLYTVKERARMQGLFGVVWGLASVAGPILGGLITDYWSWHWAFYVNVPIGFLAAGIMAVGMRESPQPANRTSIDYRGALLMMGIVTLLLGILSQGGKTYAWTSSPIVIACLILAGTIWLFIRVENRASDPILPLNLFQNPMFRAACITGFLTGIAMFGALSYIPLFVQAVIGTSATAAGSVLTPLMLGWVVSSIVASRMLLKIGIRPTLIIGLIILLLGCIGLIQFDMGTAKSTVASTMVMVGAGFGLAFTPLLIAMQNAVPRAQLGVATSASQFFRTIGGAVGLALLGSVMTERMQGHFIDVGDFLDSGLSRDQIQNFLQHPDAIVNAATRAMLPPDLLHAMQNILANALHHTFIVTLVIVVIALISACFIPRCSPRDFEAMGER